MSGEQMYEAYRSAKNRRKRGDNPEPRWKNLKPWLKRVWDEAATNMEAA